MFLLGLKSLRLSFIIRPQAVLKKQSYYFLFARHFAFLMLSAHLTPEPYEIRHTFVLITTVAVITVLNLFPVVTSTLLTSNIGCVSTALPSSALLRWKYLKFWPWQGLADPEPVATLCFCVLVWGKGLSLCSSDWLMAYSVAQAGPQSYALPPVSASKIPG